jgi:hypothetical protein
LVVLCVTETELDCSSLPDRGSGCLEIFHRRADSYLDVNNPPNAFPLTSIQDLA